MGEAPRGEQELDQIDARGNGERLELDGAPGFALRLDEPPGGGECEAAGAMRGNESDKRAAVAAGADAYIIKSDFSHGGLLATLERFIT
jgi:hypothetical protein